MDGLTLAAWLAASGATVSGVAVPILYPSRRRLAQVLLALGISLMLAGVIVAAWPWAWPGISRRPFESLATALLLFLAGLSLGQRVICNRKIALKRKACAELRERERREREQHADWLWRSRSNIATIVSSYNQMLLPGSDREHLLETIAAALGIFREHYTTDEEREAGHAPNFNEACVSIFTIRGNPDYPVNIYELWRAVQTIAGMRGSEFETLVLRPPLDRNRRRGSGVSAKEREQLENMRQAAGYLSERLRPGRRVGEHEVEPIRQALVTLDDLASRLSHYTSLAGAARNLIAALASFMPDQTGQEERDPLIGHQTVFGSVEARRAADEAAISARNAFFAESETLLGGD